MCRHEIITKQSRFSLVSPRYLVELVSVDLERAAHEPRVVVEHASEVLGSAAVEEVALPLHLQAGAQSIIQEVSFVRVTQSK